MGVVHSPNSDLGRELAKWEQHDTQYTAGQDDNGNPIQPGNRYVYRPYPAMLYQATVDPKTGQPVVFLPAPHPHTFERPEQYERAILQVETFNAAHNRIVRNDDESRRAQNEGWRETPELALEAFEQRRLSQSDAAAEVAYAAQRMTPQAQAELKEADAATDKHVTDVTPRLRRRIHRKHPDAEVTGG